MKRVVPAAAVSLLSTLAAAGVEAQEPPKVQIPQPGVPQIMTLQLRGHQEAGRRGVPEEEELTGSLCAVVRILGKAQG